MKLDTVTALCYNKTTIKSARETSSVTAQQPAKRKVLKLERWGTTINSGSCQIDGSFFCGRKRDTNVLKPEDTHFMSTGGRRKRMKSLQSLLDEYDDKKFRIYVYLKTEELGKRFLRQAENEGFTFCDGAKPSRRETDSIFALNGDKTINYVGFVGHMAYGGAEKIGERTLVRIKYDEQFGIKEPGVQN